MGKGHTDFDATLLLALVPTDQADEKTGYQIDELPDGVQFACVKTDTGYVTEAAIPRAYLDEAQGESWEMFRLGMAINDLDDPAADRRQRGGLPGGRRSHHDHARLGVVDG